MTGVQKCALPIYEQNYDLWRIITKTNNKSEQQKIYIDDSTLNLSNANDIIMDIIFSENDTGFYGTIKNKDGSLYTDNALITVNSVNTYKIHVSARLLNGNYQISGLIPGEYKFIVSFGDVERDTTNGLSYKYKVLSEDSTYTISTLEEQKQVDLLYDESKLKIIEQIIIPPF